MNKLQETMPFSCYASTGIWQWGNIPETSNLSDMWIAVTVDV